MVGGDGGGGGCMGTGGTERTGGTEGLAEGLTGYGLVRRLVRRLRELGWYGAIASLGLWDLVLSALRIVGSVWSALGSGIWVRPWVVESCVERVGTCGNWFVPWDCGNGVGRTLGNVWELGVADDGCRGG